VHPHQSRRLRDNPEWIEVTKYAAPGNFMLGEIGRINDVVFIETTQVRKVTGGAGAGYTADNGVTGNGNRDRYDSIMIGDNAFGHAIALPVELRDGGVLDFGREHQLAWYAIWGFGLITNSAVVVVETN
jgi:N4-gp56 family major capsid protein